MIGNKQLFICLFWKYIPCQRNDSETELKAGRLNIAEKKSSQCHNCVFLEMSKSISFRTMILT